MIQYTVAHKRSSFGQWELFQDAFSLSLSEMPRRFGFQVLAYLRREAGLYEHLLDGFRCFICIFVV